MQVKIKFPPMWSAFIRCQYYASLHHQHYVSLRCRCYVRVSVVGAMCESPSLVLCESLLSWVSVVSNV